MTPASFLEIEALGKSFGAGPVLSDLSLAIGRGEIFALLGPSGSGKTTALRLLAGFETPDAGRIRVEGEEVTRLAPERRRFGMVFQHYALFPHLSVEGNVAFGLAGAARERAGTGRAAVAARVREVLNLVGLAGFEARPVAALSGGQQQRVALARALAPEPRVLLLDEPLSNLDPALRERTRRALAALIRRVSITTVLVTHEQEEAFDLGDRVGVLHGGRLEQVGPPEELYRRPATRFVAAFVGRASALPGRLAWGEGGRAAVALAGSGEPAVAWEGDPADGLAAEGAPVELLMRPESLAFAGEGGATLSGRVVDRRYAGPLTYYTVALAAGPEVEVLAAPEAARAGDLVRVAPGRSALVPRIFPRSPEEAEP
jgi:ABC-type Fe3+/spermidine/putrescine transport system ATPase subunit